jgi:hypothetical protein
VDCDSSTGKVWYEVKDIGLGNPHVTGSYTDLADNNVPIDTDRFRNEWDGYYINILAQFMDSKGRLIQQGGGFTKCVKKSGPTATATATNTATPTDTATSVADTPTPPEGNDNTATPTNTSTAEPSKTAVPTPGDNDRYWFRGTPSLDCDKGFCRDGLVLYWTRQGKEQGTEDGIRLSLENLLPVAPGWYNEDASAEANFKEIASKYQAAGVDPAAKCFTYEQYKAVFGGTVFNKLVGRVFFAGKYYYFAIDWPRTEIVNPDTCRIQPPSATPQESLTPQPPSATPGSPTPGTPSTATNVPGPSTTPTPNAGVVIASRSGNGGIIILVGSLLMMALAIWLAKDWLIARLRRRV